MFAEIGLPHRPVYVAHSALTCRVLLNIRTVAAEETQAAIPLRARSHLKFNVMEEEHW
jgi:hypothetical protein